MKIYSSDYVIGRPYQSETTGLQGHLSTTRWLDQNGHLVRVEVGGVVTADWEGQTHFAFICDVTDEDNSPCECGE